MAGSKHTIRARAFPLTRALVEFDHGIGRGRRRSGSLLRRWSPARWPPKLRAPPGSIPANCFADVRSSCERGADTRGAKSAGGGSPSSPWSMSWRGYWITRRNGPQPRKWTQNAVPRFRIKAGELVELPRHAFITG